MTRVLWTTIKTKVANSFETLYLSACKPNIITQKTGIIIMNLDPRDTQNFLTELLVACEKFA
jgi:hypothetical protein